MTTSESQAIEAPRGLQRVVNGQATQDGAGVSLTRLMGAGELNMLDPFLLIDVFRSDNPDDYIAGFPDHPHRGFETLTYLLAGQMRHSDSQGNQGVLGPGGMQWMRAGRGVIHSEMPEQVEGLLEGVQIWLNLPASLKMGPPDYADFDAAAIPLEEHAGAAVRVIAGTSGAGTVGALADTGQTALIYLDIALEANAEYQTLLPEGHQALVMVLQGGCDVVGVRIARLQTDQLGVLSEGDGVQLRATSQGARVLLLAAQPLDEPVARGGPFVMNTPEQIAQAFADYRAGLLG